MLTGIEELINKTMLKWEDFLEMGLLLEGG